MISIIAMLSMFLFVFALTVSWAIYTKNDNEKDIKKAANIFASIIFYGGVILMVTVTLIYS